MAGMIELNLAPDRRVLRQFGFLALGGFALLALLAWQGWVVFALVPEEARPVLAGTLGALGALSGVLSLVWPAANRPLYVGLAVVAFPIGFVVSYVIMGALFYLLIAPVGLVFRLFGRDPLDRRFLPEAETYWVDAGQERPRESYFKQF